MKKTLLIIVSFFLFISCNFKAGGNKGVIEETHEPASAEQMHSENHINIDEHHSSH